MTEKSTSRKSRYTQRFDEALLPTGSDFFDKNQAATEELREAMYSDELTGLLNRRGFKKEVRQLQENLVAEGMGGYIALVSCDLDNFKDINDMFGHEAGDKVLQSVAGMITRSVREDDIVARWGGDEFVVAIPLPHSFDDIRPADVARGFDLDIKRRLKEAVTAGDIYLGLIGVSSGVEIGKAGDLDGLMGMLDTADQRMYTRKQRSETQLARTSKRAGAAAVSLSHPDRSKATAV